MPKTLERASFYVFARLKVLEEMSEGSRQNRVEDG